MRELSNQAQAAKLIRKELKAAFPGIKFSVTSKGFSMGDSVDIDWTDGPTSKQVKEITDKYQYGHFNGMEDIYEYSNNRSDLPQSKYVMTQRTISKEIYEIMLNEWFAWGGDFERIEGDNDRFIRDGQTRYVSQESHRFLNKLDLREPLTRERVYQSQFTI